MRYEGVSCESCGWATLDNTYPHCTCHRASPQERFAKNWWCDKWEPEQEPSFDVAQRFACKVKASTRQAEMEADVAMKGYYQHQTP